MEKVGEGSPHERLPLPKTCCSAPPLVWHVELWLSGKEDPSPQKVKKKKDKLFQFRVDLADFVRTCGQSDRTQNLSNSSQRLRAWVSFFVSSLVLFLPRLPVVKKLRCCLA